MNNAINGVKFVPKILLKSRKDLINELKKKGLPASIPRLNYFEQMNLIPYPEFGLKRGENGFDRLYTDLQINAAVLNVENYVKNKKKFGNQE